MPVTIPLQRFVQLLDESLREFWPEGVRYYSEQLEADPTNRTCWDEFSMYLFGVQQEGFDDKQCEPGMAKICHYIAWNPKVSITKSDKLWRIEGLPAICGRIIVAWTIIGGIAEAADAVDKANDELNAKAVRPGTIPEAEAIDIETGTDEEESKLTRIGEI